MNPANILGILCMCLGLATMFLGTAMVPVATPVWADMDIGYPVCQSHEHCKTMQSPCYLLSGGYCSSGGCDNQKSGCGGCRCSALPSNPTSCKCRY
jgi:hypothetical protein